MKAIVISYSLTGNNTALADGLARELGATHLRVEEPKPRGNGAIALDMLFNRIPKVALPEARVEEFDLAVFVAPVWMGMVASPLRSCLASLGPRLRSYAFVSICGGSDGPGSNPALAKDLSKRTGSSPAAVLDLHIADLLPAEPKPTREMTSTYKLSEAEVRGLAEKAAAALRAAARDRA